MSWISNAIGSVFEAIFGCRHRDLSRPFTIDAQTYKVCLNCAKQVFYSTERMQPLTGRELRRLRATQASLLPAGVAVMPATAAAREAVAQHGQGSTAAA
jgi:hypothetical protein